MIHHLNSTLLMLLNTEDSRILKNSAIGKKFIENRMSILGLERINHTDMEASFLIGDEIFCLRN